MQWCSPLHSRPQKKLPRPEARRFDHGLWLIEDMRQGEKMPTETTYDDAPTRYEMNRFVRSVLTRHRADLELISISCTTRVVYLYGYLVKTTKPGYKPAEVDAIFREIEQIPMVRAVEADLENWTISASKGSGTLLVIPRRRTLQSGAAADQEEHRIEQAEDIKDVLDDIEKEKPEKLGT